MRKVLLISFLVCVKCCLIAQDNSTVNLRLWSSKTAQYNRAAQLVSLIPDFKPNNNAAQDLSRYGSNLKIRTDSTGFYYVKKIDDRWWLIDPDGYAGVNMAVTTILTPNNKAEWAYDFLKEIGFNGAGNFITPENLPIQQYNNKSFEQFSYTRRGLGDRNIGPTSGGGFFQRYQSYRKTKGYTFPSSKDNALYITIMDPEFEEFCDIHAKNYIGPYSNERNLLGHFSDNEINFNQDQILFFIRDLSESDPNHQSALEFIASKGISKTKVLTNYASISDNIKGEYAGIIAERYYKLVSAAIRKYDSNHLYLGSRLHGRPRAIQHVVAASARYCDVISVNFYNKPTPKEEISNPVKWGVWTNDKPCLITEFYVKGLEPSGIDLQSGAGFMVKTQQDRATFYQNTCLEVLQSKFYIGWQYFRWMDDDKTGSQVSNKGIVSPDYKVWKELAASMKELNSQVYQLIDFFDGRSYTIPESKEIELIPVSDSFVNTDDNTLYGNDKYLSVSKLNGKEIYLKFDLSEYKNQLSSNLLNAKLRLYFASKLPDNCDLKVYGVNHDNWDETNLNGEYINNNPVMQSSFGRLRSHQTSLGIEKSYVDLPVRNWLAYRGNNSDLVTFRVIDNSQDGKETQWYSKESDVINCTPKLILTLNQSESTNIHLNESPSLNVYQFNKRLYYTGLTEPMQCTIYNIEGVCIYSQLIYPGEFTELSFSKGVYLVKLDNGKQSYNRKISIEY